jgi:hypothetical protein
MHGLGLLLRVLASVVTGGVVFVAVTVLLGRRHEARRRAEVGNRLRPPPL